MDCELVDGGLLAQDLNGWSSLAYVVAGLAVVRTGPRQIWRSVLGSALVAVGAGSLLYHGDPSLAAGGWLHDVSLVVLLGFVAGWQTGRLRGRAGATAVSALALCGSAGGVLLAAAPGATNAVVATLAALAVAAEVAGRTSGRGGLLSGRAAVVGGAALLAAAMGRTGSPLCDAGSLVQWHAVWHALSAVLALMWGRSALGGTGVSSCAAAPTGALR